MSRNRLIDLLQGVEPEPPVDEDMQRIAQSLMYADPPMRDHSWLDKYGHLASPGGWLVEGAQRLGFGQTAHGADQWRNAGGGLDSLLALMSIGGAVGRAIPGLADRSMARSLMTFGPNDAAPTVRGGLAARELQASARLGERTGWSSSKGYGGRAWDNIYGTPDQHRVRMGENYLQRYDKEFYDDFIRGAWTNDTTPMKAAPPRIPSADVLPFRKR